MNRVGTTSLMLAAALLTGGSAAPKLVAAAEDGAQIASRLADEYGVQVLRVRRAEQNGVAVFLITVMNPGGDFNEAFQVTTLAVNAETGKLMPAFRHGASRQQSSQAPTFEAERQPGEALRQGLFRR